MSELRKLFLDLFKESHSIEINDHFILNFDNTIHSTSGDPAEEVIMINACDDDVVMHLSNSDLDEITLSDDGAVWTAGGFSIVFHDVTRVECDLPNGAPTKADLVDSKTDVKSLFLNLFATSNSIEVDDHYLAYFNDTIHSTNGQPDEAVIRLSAEEHDGFEMFLSNAALDGMTVNSDYTIWTVGGRNIVFLTIPQVEVVTEQVEAANPPADILSIIESLAKSAASECIFDLNSGVINSDISYLFIPDEIFKSVDSTESLVLDGEHELHPYWKHLSRDEALEAISDIRYAVEGALKALHATGAANCETSIHDSPIVAINMGAGQATSFELSRDENKVGFRLVNDPASSHGQITGHMNAGHNLGLSLSFDGYGDSLANDASGSPVFIEKYEGSLRLVVYADINQEDPTHVIPLEGASIKNRNAA